MFQWEPFHIQISMANDKKIVVRRQVAQMMTASLFVQPFKWSSMGVITLTVRINGYPAKAIYDPGSVGLALSKWFVERNQLKPDETVTMTILGSEGASTLDRAVFNSLETIWEDTKVYLPAVVLPLVSFDCLLGMSWICAVGANLNIEEGCIQLKEKSSFTSPYPFPSILKSPPKLPCSRMKPLKSHRNPLPKFRLPHSIKDLMEEWFVLL